jgi:nucleoid-associated protein YgaU
LAFKDARDELATVFTLRGENDAQGANDAYGRAKDYYDQALPIYEKSLSDVDYGRANVADQRTRLENLRDNGEAYASGEYADTTNKILTIHEDVNAKLDACDIAGAQEGLDQVEALLRALEDIIADAIAKANLPPDPVAELQRILNGYTDACADIAFADARNELDLVLTFREEGDNAAANAAYGRAKGAYDAALPDYEKAASDVDGIRTVIADQRVRLENLREDGETYLPAEYAETERAVIAYHEDANDRLDTCDINGAQYDIDQAEDLLNAFENNIAAAMVEEEPVKETIEEEVIEVPAEETIEEEEELTPLYPEEPTAEIYIVQKGDCLWKIAADKYAEPFFWPLIYWNNTTVIKDPDLIYPDQELLVDSLESYDLSSKNLAEDLAKTRGAWSLYDNK